MSRPPADRKQALTVWHGLLLAEGAAVMIALLMPVTPSKTGSGRGIPEYLLADPGYPMQVLVYFFLTNILLVVIALAFWVWLRFQRP